MRSQFIDENGQIVETSKPMSHYITESLRNVCKEVEVEPYGEDSRLANIKGLFIRAKVDMNKKSRQHQDNYDEPAGNSDTVDSEDITGGGVDGSSGAVIGVDSDVDSTVNDVEAGIDDAVDTSSSDNNIDSTGGSGSRGIVI